MAALSVAGQTWRKNSPPLQGISLWKRGFNRYPLALSAAKGLKAASVRQTLRCAQGERE